MPSNFTLISFRPSACGGRGVYSVKLEDGGDMLLGWKKMKKLREMITFFPSRLLGEETKLMCMMGDNIPK